MSKAAIIGHLIVSGIETGLSIEEIKKSINPSVDEWYRYSSKANQLYLEKNKKTRNAILNRPNTSGASEQQIATLIKVNNALANYALCMNIFSTQAEIDYAEKLTGNLPETEPDLIAMIGRITMHPKIRVLQKKGRFQVLSHFKIFVKIIDAATISFYRENYISCYLTLIPVIEGIIIRWMGFTGNEEKPEFEKIRNFFKKSPQRQPCPYNILFHDIFVKACDKILNDHLYKPSNSGIAYGNFNRHVASHFLNDDQFATKENCIRLFILIDAMTEIFINEGRLYDSRFELGSEEIGGEIKLYTEIMLSYSEMSPENILLN